MNEEEKIALFDAFIQGDLGGEDLVNFQRLLDKSESFKAEFEAYFSFAQQIRDGEQYGRINKNLRKIHHEIYHAPKKPILLRPIVLTILSSAALIALLITVVPNLLNTSGSEDMAQNDYQELNGDSFAAEESTEINVEYEGSQENKDSSLNQSEFESDAIDVLDESIAYSANIDPNGTCFLISQEGYFITAKHLVKKRKTVLIQQKELNLAINTEVIYRDSLLDFAILRCSPYKAEQFERVPFKIMKENPSLGEDVFTLGYPKGEIVYTKGTVSSENGFKSDSLTYEISMPANKGNSGAPLFGDRGNLAGFIVANNSKKQSVTYVVKPSYILDRIQSLSEYEISLNRNYTKASSKRSTLIKAFRPFVFEVQ